MRPATRISTPKTAPQRYASARIGTSPQSAMSPGKGTRPRTRRRVRARDEAQRERADLALDGAPAGVALDDLDAVRRDALCEAERRGRARAEDARARGARDERDVERMVEVRVPDHDGVGARHVAPDGVAIGAQAARADSARARRASRTGRSGACARRARRRTPRCPASGRERRRRRAGGRARPGVQAMSSGLQRPHLATRTLARRAFRHPSCRTRARPASSRRSSARRRRRTGATDACRA